MKVRALLGEAEEGGKPLTTQKSAQVIEDFFNDFVTLHHDQLLSLLVLKHLSKNEQTLMRPSELTFKCTAGADTYRCVCRAEAADFANFFPDYSYTPYVTTTGSITDYPGDFPVVVEVTFKLAPAALRYIATFPLQAGTTPDKLKKLIDENTSITNIDVVETFDETKTWDRNDWEAWRDLVLRQSGY